jgi:hypothetical protein
MAEFTLDEVTISQCGLKTCEKVRQMAARDGVL